MFAAHPLLIFAVDAAEISYVAPAVRSSIGVDDLTIETGLGDAEAVIVTHYRRRIHHKRNDVALSRFFQERGKSDRSDESVSLGIATIALAIVDLILGSVRVFRGEKRSCKIDVAAQPFLTGLMN